MKKKLLGAVLSVGAIVGLASCMEVHEHEFATDWSSNASGHWHACACDERLLDSFSQSEQILFLTSISNFFICLNTHLFNCFNNIFTRNIFHY